MSIAQEAGVKPVLEIRLSDLFRATLASDCGNEGYIGIAPDGSRYHVVVPVDRQISRGLKFWIRPDDGTPFGGYKDWHYFCCLTYEVPERKDAEQEVQLHCARENGWLIQKWAKALGLEITVIDDMKTKDGFQGD